MDWSRALRAQLHTRAEAWASKEALPHYESVGQDPTILFERDLDGRRHGNFHLSSWRAISANPAWARRLEKVHSQVKALPEEKRALAKELDSSNSSDALLMNCFCFPGAVERILSGLRLPTELGTPDFGYLPRLSLSDGTLDDTEVDMRIGTFFVEAKLTEKDFTTKVKAHVFGYRDFTKVFDVDALPGDESTFTGYQLIRNVLAAAQHNASFVVLVDQRRPDLLQEWWNVHAAIRDSELRERCGFRTWQQVAAAAPHVLKDFLELKYGL